MLNTVGVKETKPHPILKQNKKNILQLVDKKRLNEVCLHVRRGDL